MPSIVGQGRTPSCPTSTPFLYAYKMHPLSSMQRRLLKVRSTRSHVMGCSPALRLLAMATLCAEYSIRQVQRHELPSKFQGSRRAGVWPRCWRGCVACRHDPSNDIPILPNRVPVARRERIRICPNFRRHEQPIPILIEYGHREGVVPETRASALRLPSKGGY